MLFESLDRDEQARAEQQSGVRAIIAANQKVAASIEPYLAPAMFDRYEYKARLEYVTGAVENFVRDACTEYEADYDVVLREVLSQLRYSCKECGCDCSDGDCSCKDCTTCNGSKESNTAWSDETKLAHHPEGCGCLACTNMRRQEGDYALKEDGQNTTEAHTAADVETGDTFTTERVSLPSANEDGHSQDGSPKIDKSPVPKDGLKAVDVPSKEHPSEMQDVEQKADHDTQTDQGATATPDSTSHPRERVDADSPMQPAETHGPHTKSFPKGKQADPVTSKWTVVGQSETD